FWVDNHPPNQSATAPPRAIPQMGASLLTSPIRLVNRGSEVRFGACPSCASSNDVEDESGPKAPREFSRMTTQVPATPAVKQYACCPEIGVGVRFCAAARLATCALSNGRRHNR